MKEHTNKGSCVAISANRWDSCRLFGLDPLVLFSVKHSKLTVVLLAVVTSENV